MGCCLWGHIESDTTEVTYQPQQQSWGKTADADDTAQTLPGERGFWETPSCNSLCSTIHRSSAKTLRFAGWEARNKRLTVEGSWGGLNEPHSAVP